MMAKIPGTGKDLGVYWSCSSLFYWIFIFIFLSVLISSVENFFIESYYQGLETYKIRTSVKILFYCLQIQR